MELFDRIGIYSIDFILYLGFKIAQSHLREQAQDSLKGEGADFASSSSGKFDGTEKNVFKNNRLRSVCDFRKKHKLMITHRDLGNHKRGLIFIHEK